MSTAATNGSDGTPERAPASDRAGVREYAFGPFRVNVPYCQLRREEDLVPLTPKAFDTLVFLMAHRDHVVSKDELMTALWPNSFVSDDALAQNIWAIRRALGDDPDKQEFIATIPRRGYRFVAAVAETYGASHPEIATGVGEAGAATSTVAASIEGAFPSASVPGTGVELTGHADGVTVSARPVDMRRSWYALAAAVVLVAAAWVVTQSQRADRLPLSPSGLVRFMQESPQGATIVSGGQLSPDGRQLVFVAQDEATGQTQIWVRSLDAAEPRPLAGTQGASRPFWSPDGRYVGFFADSSLRRVGLWDDEPRILTPVAGIRVPGASWSRRDLILFAGSNRSGLSVVPANGGEPRAVTTLNTATGDVAHRWPHFLPDGRHFLYSVVSRNANRSGIYIGALDSAEPHVRVLDAAVVSAIYAPPGYLLYVLNGLLMAHPFDASELRLTGAAVSVASDVPRPGALSDAVLSASADGVLTFGGGPLPQRLVWIDRQGNQIGRLNVALLNPSLSPDGRQLLGTGVSADVEGGGISWLDLEQGVPTEIVPDGMIALWEPDRSRIAYVVQRLGQSTLHFKSIENATGDAVPVWERDGALYLNSWSPDREYIVYVSAPGKQTLWLLRTSGKVEAKPYSESRFNQIQGQVSPDGQAIAYASDESGVWEVYLDSFPVPGTKRRISIAGGTQPQWSRSGSELFYLALDRILMRVDFAGGQAARPQPMFKAPVLGALTNYRNHYAVAPDGRRFLFSAGTEEPITIMFNWVAGLR